MILTNSHCCQTSNQLEGQVFVGVISIMTEIMMLFMGGAANLPSQLYINNNGKLKLSDSSGLNKYAKPEITCCIFFDVDSDNDLDLVVGSGSNEFPIDDSAYIDHLYLNDGKDKFVLSSNYKAPSKPTSSLSTIDINNDGNLDIIVGGSSVAGSYPIRKNLCNA